MSTTSPVMIREITDAIRRRAREVGFDHIGIAPVTASEHAGHYRRWIDAGMAGEMGYLAREDAVEKRADPTKLVPEARSAIVVARNYFPGGAPDDEGIGPDRAIFARYARNEDYHELLKKRLIELQDWIDAEMVAVGGRAYIDTGPVLERELAVRAGLGWQARNTMHIIPGAGSYHFLGVILVDIELDYDAPFTRDHCGSCTACVTACPTGALLGRDDNGAPILDARRCISYLTIELKGPIPRELRPLIGNRVFGCDICQEVCPHSRKFSEVTSERAFWPREGVHGTPLVELMSLSQQEFSSRFKGSPVKRAKRRGLLRNVAVALGNWGSQDAVPVLAHSLWDEEPLIRGHSAWALGRIGTEGARQALRGRLDVEDETGVREELELALGCRRSIGK